MATPPLPHPRSPAPSSARVFVKQSHPRLYAASWRSSWRPRCLVGSSRRESCTGRLWEVKSCIERRWFSWWTVIQWVMTLSLSTGLFEVRVQEYLDSIHENEHRRVNRFLKGLGKAVSKTPRPSEQTTYTYIYLHLIFFFTGNKMKFLSKK